jgi:protein gp37
MSSTSKIQWTDATWNPVRGCVKVSAGCKNCYAETFAERFRGVLGHPYEQGFDLRLVPEKLEEPLRWKKPRRVFVNSMSDLFQVGVPDAFIDQTFAVMAQTSRHTYQILTKRSERLCSYSRAMAALDPKDRAMRVIRSMYAGHPAERLAVGGMTRENTGDFPWPLPNVWLGVSVENQHFADERIPLLLQTPAAVRFISAEPLLEAVRLRNWLKMFRNDHVVDPTGVAYQSLDWVIVGGESGPGARPFDLAWCRSIVEQCQADDVPVFVKQLGANAQDADGAMHGRYSAGGIKHDFPKLVDRKGGDMEEWPLDLRVREFPRISQVSLAHE